MTDVTRALLDRYKAKRSTREEPLPGAIDERRRAYRQAAAVLHRFSAETLQPRGGRLEGESPRLILFSDVDRVTGEAGEVLFHLKPDVRRNALGELLTRAAMLETLEANPQRLKTRLQETWEEYLRSGTLPDLATLRYADLTNVCQIVGWMEDLDDSLPRSSEVLELARQKSVFSSFEHLVDSRFTGRTAELKRLREHIGALPDKASAMSVQRQLQAWVGGKRKAILAIHGPGGIGKTALIGTLLLDHAEANPKARIPFAYLAFDQPSLRIETPFTILVEAASQFELQWPEHRTAIEEFRADVRRVREQRSDLGDRRKLAASRGERIDEVQRLDNTLYVSFAKAIRTLAKRPLDKKTVQVPVLLVLDTFEEVQYRDRESLSGLWRMLAAIQREYEPFRVIISGRGAVEVADSKTKVEQFALPELSLPDRLTLLRRLGVTDPAMMDVVAQQVGGNPLSLRLAANLITSYPTEIGPSGIADLTTKKWLLFRAGEEVIQGQLYRRILAHIHDESVARLAHPGMVLRRVTPEVILEVLAPVFLSSVRELPPEQQVPEAKRLFEMLKAENALVTMDLEGALVYRPEIRRSMVRLLEQDRLAEVRTLRRAAIDYYSRGEGVSARAEEMYHRLALGEDDFPLLDTRWLPGIEQSIAASVDEYPPRVQAWLASRMDLEVPREVFENAATADWERNIARKVQRALSYRGVKEALALLGERKDRTPASPIFALEVKAHLLEEDYEDAARVVEAGIARVADSNNRGRLAELFWLQSQVALLRGNAAAADQALSRAEQAIEGAHNPLPVIHVLAHRLLLRQEIPGKYDETPSALRLRLDRACARLDDATAYSAEFVIRLAATLLGDEYPRTRDRLGEFVEDTASLEGLDEAQANPLTSENLQGLDEYREAWEREAEPTSEAAV